MTRLFRRGSGVRRSRVTSVGLLLVAVAAVVLVPTAPASASGSTTVSFTGAMYDSGGPNIRNWSMSSTSCFAADVNITTPTSSSGVLCSLAAAGTVSGPCASATGSGTMWIYVGFTPPLGWSTIEVNYQLVQTATTLTFIGSAYHHGTGAVGTMEGHAVLYDNFGTASTNCVSNNGFPSYFTVEGAVQISFP
jgi:hypothetical protein